MVVLYIVVISYRHHLVAVLLFLRDFVQGNLLLLMVVYCCLCVIYFPYDNGLADDIYKFGAVLSELEEALCQARRLPGLGGGPCVQETSVSHGGSPKRLVEIWDNKR